MGKEAGSYFLFPLRVSGKCVSTALRDGLTTKVIKFNSFLMQALDKEALLPLFYFTFLSVDSIY